MKVQACWTYALTTIFFIIFFAHWGMSDEVVQNPFPQVQTNTKGFPALVADDEFLPAIAYTSYFGTEELYRQAASQGIHLYCFPAYLGDRGVNSRSGIGPFRKGIWQKDNTLDMTDIEEDITKILRADPLAKIIMRIHLDPPLWWEQAHPEGCCQRSDGTTLRQCFASDIWFNATDAALRKLLQKIAQASYAKHLIGVHVAAGQTEEWMAHYGDTYEDRNPARLEAFRQWLQHRYGSDTKLQAAWGDTSVTLPSAQLGDISGATRQESWRDPITERNVLDTFQFQADTLVARIEQFCQSVKAVSEGHLVTGAFYGYHFYVADARIGFGALHRLLESPHLDYLASPNTYNRNPGEDWLPMVAVDSVRLHGKIWMAENDTRTSCTTLLKEIAPHVPPPGKYEGGVWLGPKSKKISEALLWNNVARMLTHNYGGWWFDMWGGWFSHPRFQAVLRRSQEWAVEQIGEKKEALPYTTQVCAITDEQLAFYDASFGQLAGKILSNRNILSKMGSPYNVYLRSDWQKLSYEKYRFLWLLGINFLSSKEREQIQKWRHAGVGVLLTDTEGSRFLPPHTAVDTEEQHWPARLTWDTAKLRPLYSQCNVHRYLETDDVVYAGHGWLAIHAASAGKKHIQFPQPCQVYDVINNEILEIANSSLTLRFSRYETRLFKLRPNPVSSPDATK